MRIIVKAYSVFSDYIDGECELNAPENLTIKDLVAYIYNTYKIPREIKYTIIVNHKIVDENYVLKDGDIVIITPPFSGG